MSVLYRGLWTDVAVTDPRGLVAQAREHFCRWATEPDGTPDLPDGESVVGPRTVRLRAVDVDGLYGVEGVAVDAPASEVETVWTTTMKVVAAEGDVHYWIENGMETDDLARRVKVGRPRLVYELLKLPGSHRLASSGVFTDVLDIPVEGVPILVDQLRNPSRALPMIVFTEPTDADGGRWLRLAERTARRAGGVATVVTIHQSAITRFRTVLGQLAVWGGAARTYLPAPMESELDGWRHRYILAYRMEGSEGAIIDRLVYAVTQLSTRRRPNEVFTHFDSERSTESSADRYELEFELELERDERGQIEKDLARATGHLRRLEVALKENNLEELFWGTHDPALEQDEPDEVQDVTEAVLTAQEILSEWITIPDSALQELDGVDSAPNAYAWGNTTWRGLRALAAYARAKSAGAQGDFWAWCERGEPLAWPATPKKLSMKESETVENNAGYRRARTFEVSGALADRGAIYMGAHLKISEGGGNLAPRVYFHDDTGGSTAKIHVGFIGPHHLVPNTKS